ncbi:hypothetical protein BN1723_012796 [Verticillium longisporum]|uniref:Mediator of RNA polymerase II transcription subunit 7 n=1 Tax=Verticillium longisporum TaxID=100787 RepID=A0A0G4LLB7_VERLO|nr:hypothetical protein BN1723_012796 [Verticillium longisporum]
MSLFGSRVVIFWNFRTCNGYCYNNGHRHPIIVTSHLIVHASYLSTSSPVVTSASQIKLRSMPSNGHHLDCLQINMLFIQFCLHMSSSGFRISTSKSKPHKIVFIVVVVLLLFVISFIIAFTFSGIPDELINLQPPAEPSTGTWRVLGGQYSLDDKLPSLEEVNIKRLASAHNDERDGKHLDRAFELKRMAKSLLLNFLELVGVMGITPEDSTAKVDDLRTLLMNFHHVLNEYRPHQARESGIALMQSHLDRTRAETAAIRAQVDSAKRVLEGLGSIDILQTGSTSEPASKGNEQSASKDVLDRREREVWEAADELFI